MPTSFAEDVDDDFTDPEDDSDSFPALNYKVTYGMNMSEHRDETNDDSEGEFTWEDIDPIWPQGGTTGQDNDYTNGYTSTVVSDGPNKGLFWFECALRG